MNRREIVGFGLTLALTLGCTGRLFGVQDWSPGDLVAAATEQDGQIVVVVGVLRFGEEARHLWDSTAAIDSGEMAKKCLTLIGTGALRPGLFAADLKRVRMSGVFRKNIYEGKRIVDLGMCNEMGVEIHKFEVVK